MPAIKIIIVNCDERKQNKICLIVVNFEFFFKWMLFYRNATVHGEIQWHNRRDAVEPSRSVRGARLRKRRGGVGGGEGWGGVGESSSLPFSPLSRPKLIHPPVVSGPALIEQLARLLPASVFKWR